MAHGPQSRKNLTVRPRSLYTWVSLNVFNITWHAMIKTHNTEQYHNKTWPCALTWLQTQFDPPFKNASFQLLSFHTRWLLHDGGYHYDISVSYWVMILPQPQRHLDFHPDCCSLFDLSWLHIRLTPSALPVTGAETSVAKQSHIVTGHFYEVQTLMMMLPIQCWSRIYTRLCQHFSCWCSSTSRH